MADAPGGHHRSTTPGSSTRQHPSSIPSNRLITTSSLPSHSHDHEKALSALKSRRTLRQTRSMIPGKKAYPLPDPSQFENPAARVAPLSQSPSSSSDTYEILYPMQSYKRFAEKERETAKPSPPVETPVVALVVTNSQQDEMQPGLRRPPPPPDKVPAAATELVLDSLPDEVPVKGKRSKVVVVHDADKKFTNAALDVALREFAVAEGDAVVVVAFLEYIMSPMGMKMAADLEQFGGVNQTILKQSILQKVNTIENKLKETNRLQLCEKKKIQLHVKVLPGSNSKVVIAKEIIDSKATCAIFDKNAMKNRKFYEDNLSCDLHRLRSDGVRVETISHFGHGALADKTGCTLAHCSDSSSDSGSGSMNLDAPTIWSKLFGSRRSCGSRRHSSASVMGSSRTSSNLGSPSPVAQEEDEAVAEVLQESFSFDSPKPNPAAEAFVYAAAGLDQKFGSFARNRNVKSNNLPAALTA